jgi:hypothetical protein
MKNCGRKFAREDSQGRNLLGFHSLRLCQHKDTGSQYKNYLLKVRNISISNYNKYTIALYIVQTSICFKLWKNILISFGKQLNSIFQTLVFSIKKYNIKKSHVQLCKNLIPLSLKKLDLQLYLVIHNT